MAQQELFAFAIDALERAAVEHMVTGSVVSSFQGEPRSTHDIDIVIALTRDSIDRLLREFPPDRFYVSREAVSEAVASGGMFNVLDTHSADKIDFWMLTDDPFDRSRFERRIEAELFGRRVMISTPEDTILVKLRWARESGESEKQFKDAVRIYEMQESSLDRRYLDEWAAHLGVADLLADVRATAGAD